MCVFTLSCFLTKCVIPSLIVVRYIKEKVQDVRSRNVFLRIVFICSMENVVCVCAASLVGKVVSIETKWGYEKFEKAARIFRHARDCVRCSLAKVLFAVGGNKLWSHIDFCVAGDLGKPCVVSIKVAKR